MAIKRTPRVKYDDIPGSIPDGTVPQNTDHLKIAREAVNALNSLQRNHLASNILWRDQLSFTDTYRTFSSADAVFETFKKLSKLRHRSDFTLSDAPPHIIPCPPSSWLNFNVNFTIQDGELTGQCAGIISVSFDSDSQWKIWLIRTWLEHYEGHGNPDQIKPKSVDASEEVNGTNGKDHIYDAIIAGGGQAGLGLAGRLQALDMTYIVFDSKPEFGDSWALRYESLKWHTVKEYGNLPFGRTFTDEDDNLVPAKRIGAGYKAWFEKHGINGQSGTKVESARWDDDAEIWTVRTSGKMGKQEWKSRNFILSIGPAAKSPVSPHWATPEKIQASGFQGTIIHGANYREPSAFAGKRGVVIGTANTAHDVAEDMANVGMDTTMVQRSPTFIMPGEWLVAWQSHLYNLDLPTEVSDRGFQTMPNKINREISNRIIWGLIKSHPERFDALERAGFRLDRYGDVHNHITNRYGGHYVDIGSCARIVSGEIKVKGGLVRELTQDGLLFEDGTELNADLIVLCTGFEHDFRKDAAEILGQEAAEQMDDFGGTDSEGEIRALSKYAGHHHLFYHGGESGLMRFQSRFMALQLQKQKLGQPLQPYLEGK